MTANVWTDGQLELHAPPLPALEALHNADLEKSRHLLAQFVFSTEFVISPPCVSTWGRRYRQILADPKDAIWVTRLVVLKQTGEVVGQAGFHAQPDANGMVEIGYKIDPTYRRLGYGTAVIQILIDVAKRDDWARVIRASVRIGNSISKSMVLKTGFTKVGELMDEEDGLEETFEQAVQESSS